VHEMSLMQDLMKKITAVAERERAKKVVSVDVWLGALSHMSAEHFIEHFSEVSAGTLADGARLNIETSQDVKDPMAQSILFRGLEISE